MKKMDATQILIAIVGLLTAGGGTISVATFNELKATHDTMIKVVARMDGYDVQLSDIKAQLADVKVHQSKLDLEIQKLKDIHEPKKD